MFRIIPEGLAYREYVLLKDGQGVLLKPATPDDIPLVESFMGRLSQESLRMRFMASVSQVPKSVIESLCNGDFKESGCLLAIIGEDKNARVIGLGNYIGMGNGRSAEVAFLVEDAYQGRGISTLLLERLAGLAAANGFVDLEAEVLPENQPMINVFKASGFASHQVWEAGNVHIELPVNGAAALWERADLRERIAVANSLIPLMRPKIIAVVGASRDTTSIGNMVFRNLLHNGFTGTIYPINPQADSVNGVKAYASIRDLPEPIDLAVVSVPAESVFKVAEDCIQAGAKGLLVVSAGFAEAGTEGAERQKKLVELVRAHGVRLLGPSCLGLMNTDPEIRLNASLAPVMAKRGPAGFFSHSAALGLVILDYAEEKGIGFSSFVSAGNRADVSGNDLLQYWEEDSQTQMAILYLEAFGNPRRFVRIARRMSHKKPILCVKSARSQAGKQTAEAKAGIPTGGTAEVEALFQQTGIILAETLDELFDAAVVLAHQPLPKGNRVAIVANSAGMATLFADACESNGLIISGTGLINLGAFTSPEKYEAAVRESLLHTEVDALLVGYACVGHCGPDPMASAIRKGVHWAEQQSGTSKPVLLCLMGASGSISLVEESGQPGEERMFPAFRFPESAPRALSKVVRYAQYRSKPVGKLVWYEDVNADKARKEVQKILDKIKTVQDGVKVPDKNVQAILSYFGINVSEEEPKEDHILSVHIRPDRLFGPLLEIKAAKHHSLLRVTPLMDRDIEEVLAILKMDNEQGIKQILGRLSQMIEELPWLWKLKLQAVQSDKPLVLATPAIWIIPGGAKRPEY